MTTRSAVRGIGVNGYETVAALLIGLLVDFGGRDSGGEGKVFRRRVYPGVQERETILGVAQFAPVRRYARIMRQLAERNLGRNLVMRSIDDSCSRDVSQS